MEHHHRKAWATARDAREELGISERTLARWRASGLLKPTKDLGLAGICRFALIIQPACFTFNDLRQGLPSRWGRVGPTDLSSRSADRAVASPMVSSQEGR